MRKFLATGAAIIAVSAITLIRPAPVEAYSVYYNTSTCYVDIVGSPYSWIYVSATSTPITTYNESTFNSNWTIYQVGQYNNIAHIASTSIVFGNYLLVKFTNTGSGLALDPGLAGEAFYWPSAVINFDTSSHFISLVPAGASTTGYTTSIGAHLFVDPDQYESGAYLEMKFVNNTIENGIGGSALDAWNSAFGAITIPLSSGDNVVSTSTTFTIDGNVNATYRVKVPNQTVLIGSLLPDQILISTTSTFTVNHKTGLDIAMASTTDVLVSALITGTTTQSVIRCNPVDFDITTCVISLIVPPQSTYVNALNRLKSDALTHFPLGYVTDFISILYDTSEGTMTPIDAYVPSVLPGGGAHIRLDLSHVLDTVLYATTSIYTNVSAPDTRSLYDITNDYWELVVYIMAGIYFLTRILGAHLFPQKMGGTIIETDSITTPEVGTRGRKTGIRHTVSRVTRRKF